MEIHLTVVRQTIAYVYAINWINVACDEEHALTRAATIIVTVIICIHLNNYALQMNTKGAIIIIINTNQIITTIIE